MNANDWISIKDRLPDLKATNDVESENDEVLLCICGKEVVEGKLVVSNANNPSTYRYWKSSMCTYTYLFNYVTHWQPIVLPL